MQKWNLDRYEAGQHEPSMGIRGSKMAFLRYAYYRVSGGNFEACLLSRNMEDRTAGNARERDRVLPEFPKPLAPALRFGSMNPITRFLVHGVFVASLLW